MDICICINKCGRSWRPRSLIEKTASSPGMIRMDVCGAGPFQSDGCAEFLVAELPDGIFRRPPVGWFRGCFETGSRRLEYCPGDDIQAARAIRLLWRVHLLPECGCPFYTEHMLADIEHDRRVEKWRRDRRAVRKLRGQGNGKDS